MNPSSSGGPSQFSGAERTPGASHARLLDTLDPRDELDAYLDGLLPADRAAAFERRLETDPDLRAAVDLQRALDQELRGQFHYEPRQLDLGSAPIPLNPAPTPKLRAPSPAGRLRWYAAAAVLLLALGGSIIAYINWSAGNIDPLLSPQTVYTRLVDKGFKPEFVCTDDAKFAHTVRYRFGRPLTLAAIPGVEVLGWAYGSTVGGRPVGPETLIMLARVEGKPVVVYIDRVRDDRPLEVGGSGLSVHRRVIADLVLYEISPLDRATLLESFIEPAPPPPAPP